MRDWEDSSFDDEESLEQTHRRQRALGVSDRATPCHGGGEHECDEDGTCYGCGLHIEG